MAKVERFLPIMERIKVEIIKDENLDLTGKYKYNHDRKQWEELSSMGFVISALTQTQYEELVRREQASGQKAIVRYMGNMAFFDKKGQEVEIGDTVLVTRNSGHNQLYPDTEKVFRYIMDTDILAVKREVEEND